MNKILNTVIIVFIILIVLFGCYFLSTINLNQEPEDNLQTSGCDFINNSNFKSVNQYEVGLGPNGSVMGYWSISFGENSFAWAHSDVFEEGSYTCKNNILNVKVSSQSITSSYDKDKKILTWDGIEYKMVKPNDFNFVLVSNDGTLDTANKTYTAYDRPKEEITISLSLTDEEMSDIYQKLLEIDFFNYPNEFTAKEGEIVGQRIPCSSFSLNVSARSKTKNLSWNNCVLGDVKDERLTKAENLISYILEIVQSKEEYKALPEPLLRL